MSHKTKAFWMSSGKIGTNEGYFSYFIDEADAVTFIAAWPNSAFNADAKALARLLWKIEPNADGVNSPNPAYAP